MTDDEDSLWFRITRPIIFAGGIIAIVWFSATVLLMLAIFLVYGPREAFGQHAPEHMDLHNKFYNTWMMPDNRAVSCCHDEDCQPAEAYQKNGQWFARQEKDTGDFTPIPPQKVEQDRDTPDGRSHLCGRRYGFNTGGLTVFCFIAGSGS